jgi:hypothetical protein
VGEQAGFDYAQQAGSTEFTFAEANPTSVLGSVIICSVTEMICMLGLVFQFALCLFGKLSIHGGLMSEIVIPVL